MIHRFLLPASTFCALLLASPSVFAAPYYVSSSTGSSTGDGTTTATASNSLSKIINATSAGAGDTIYLCQGDVFEEPGIVISSRTLTLSSYVCNLNKAGIKPVITGAMRIKEAPVSSTQLASGLTVWTFNVTSYMKQRSAPKINAVWANNVRHVPARYPNLINPAIQYGQDTREFAKMSAWDTNFVKPFPAYKTSTTYWKGAVLRVRENSWSYRGFNVTDVVNGRLMLEVTDKTVLKIKTIGTTPDTLPGFFLEDAYGELDAPGEFFYDQSTGLLKVIAVSGARVSDVWITPGGRLGNEINFPIIKATNCNISITRIAFTRGVIGFLPYQTTSSNYNVLFDGCSFSDFFKQGMDLSYLTGTGTTSVTVTRTSFTGTESGILVTKNGKPLLEVKDSTFTNIGLVAGHAYEPAGVCCLNKFATCNVANSVFKNLGYAAVVANKKTIIQNNIISSALMTNTDGGAIYTWGINSTDSIIINNTITNMVFNSISWVSRTNGAGIYLDDCSSNITVANNFVYLNHLLGSAIFIHNSFENKLVGNTLLNGSIVLSHDDNPFDQTKTVDFMCEPINTVARGNKFIPALGSNGIYSRIQSRYTSNYAFINRSYVASDNIFKEISKNLFCNNRGEVWNPYNISSNYASAVMYGNEEISNGDCNKTSSKTVVLKLNSYVLP